MPKIGVQLPGPPYLRLKQIAGIDKIGVITNWLKKEPAARARFRVRVEYLAKFPETERNKKQFRHLGKGLYEIKWESGKPYRALGYNEGGYFVMVLGCTHKDKVYDPPNCKTTAARLMEESKNGYWNIIDYDPLSTRTLN
jgi:putative component of toxin-antitoxin plasmid stabilization module